MTIHTRMPYADYDALPGIRSHALGDFERMGPHGFYLKHLLREVDPFEPKKDQDALDVGSAAHVLALEGPEEFAKRVAAMPLEYPAIDKGSSVMKPWNMNANYCKDWVEGRRAGGLLVVKAKLYDFARLLGYGIRDNPEVAKRIQCGFPELTITAKEEAIPVKARIDWMDAPDGNPATWRAIGDMKTTRDFATFRKQLWSLGYVRSLAWYRWVVEQECGRRLPCFIFVVEKQRPYRALYVPIEDADLDVGHDLNMRTLDRIMQCHASGSWLKYPEESGTYRPVAPPWWRGEAAQTLATISDAVGDGEGEAAPWDA